MTDVQQLLRQAWVDAKADLGIEVELLGDSVVVRNFGSPNGMLCAVRDTSEGHVDLRRQAEAWSMGWSVLGRSYIEYDRRLFIDTLNDWGWCGPGSAPSWYSGDYWTSR